MIKLSSDLKPLVKMSKFKQSFNGHNVGKDPPIKPVKIRSVFLLLLLKNHKITLEKIFNPKITPILMTQILEYTFKKSFMSK